MFDISQFIYDFATTLIIFFVILWGVRISKLSPEGVEKHHIYFFCLLTAMVIQVITPAVSYLVLSAQWSIGFLRDIEGNSWRKIFLFLHILSASFPLFLGPLLIFRPYRDAFLNKHRRLGNYYVYGTIFSAITVLPLSLTNSGGPLPRASFTIMTLLWCSFTLLGYFYAKRRQYVEHRRWMLRSFAMTFAFVHVNFTYHMFSVYSVLDLGPLGIKLMQSVFSWLINLMIIEIYLAATTYTGKFVGFRKWQRNFFSTRRFSVHPHLAVLFCRH